MSETRIWHGGNLDEARQLFPDAPEPWIDLSTGINPVSYPLPELPPSMLERLPSPNTHFDLETAAAEAYAAPLIHVRHLRHPSATRPVCGFPAKLTHYEHFPARL
jgi:histidinol-phosphate/aromatic aminotransferase/cobyric acid decarboxylase-like protein